MTTNHGARELEQVQGVSPNRMSADRQYACGIAWGGEKQSCGFTHRRPCGIPYVSRGVLLPKFVAG